MPWSLWARAALERPEDPAPLYFRGEVLRCLDRLEEAVTAFQDALALDDRMAAAWTGLGRVWAEKREYAQAVPCFRRALSLTPDDDGIRYDLAKSIFELGSTDEAIDLFQQVSPSANNGLALSTLAVIIPGGTNVDDRAILEARQRWAKQHVPAAGVGIHSPGRPRRLKIGYVSGFFHRHNWMKVVWGLINQHDRTRFDVHLFSDYARPDAPDRIPEA